MNVFTLWKQDAVDDAKKVYEASIPKFKAVVELNKSYVPCGEYSENMVVNIPHTEQAYRMVGRFGTVHFEIRINKHKPYCGNCSQM